MGLFIESPRSRGGTALASQEPKPWNDAIALAR
jgi:hypothetical protein